MLLVFYNCVYIPIEIFFLNGIVEHGLYPKQDPHIAVDFFIDFLFFVDILLNTCTAYYDDDYEMVLDRKQILRHYARCWLWIDVLAFFPFEVPFLILENAGAISGNSIPTGVFGMLKALRLLRLVRVFKKLDVVAAANALRIVALMVVFCLIAHWFACMCAASHESKPEGRRTATERLHATSRPSSDRPRRPVSQLVGHWLGRVHERSARAEQLPQQ